MTRKPKSEKKIHKLQKWKSQTAAKYHEVISKLTHFSSKSINTNALPCGVRLSSEQFIDLPYAAVSTMPPEIVPCDYYVGAQVSGIVKQFYDVITQQALAEKYENPPFAEEIKTIHAAHSLLKEPYLGDIMQVGIRLRQIIVQDNAGNNIALTPLQSTGFSHILENRFHAESEMTVIKNGKKFFRARAYLGIGGSNPQTVGRYTRDMRHSLWFKPPQENPEIQQAYAIYYKGISLTPAFVLMKKYYDWRMNILESHEGQMVTDLKKRQQETEMIYAITANIIQRAAAARELLINHAQYFPDDTLISPRVNLSIRCLLDPDVRYHNWQNDLAGLIYRAIVDYQFREQHKKFSLGVGDIESQSWINIILSAIEDEL